MTNTIPAWEIEKGDSPLDAGAECKRLTRAIIAIEKTVGALRDALQAGIKKHGNSYLETLRQTDAGIYSHHNIDDQIQQMGEDIDFITALLTVDVGPGELASRTAKAVAFPTRQEGQ